MRLQDHAAGGARAAPAQRQGRLALRVLSRSRHTLDNRDNVRAAVQMWVPKDGPSATFTVTLALARKAETLDARVVAVRRTREH